MRKFGRTDTNQSTVVRDLRKMGVSVLILSGVGEGCPDLCCGFRGRTYLFEVKDGNKRPSERRLTEDEKVFHLAWNGQVDVIETALEAMEIMCLLMSPILDKGTL